MRYVSISSDLRANANPLRSIPLFRTASAVFGPDPLFAAQAVLTGAQRAVVRMGEFFARSRVTLGEGCESVEGFAVTTLRELVGAAA